MSPRSESAPLSLAGLRVLVVEDEMLVAMMIEDLLISEGCDVVGPAATVAEAMRLFEAGGLDGAVLDVNLGAERVYPVADALAEARIPYVFVTGYGAAGLDPGHQNNPTIQKPFDLTLFGEDLARELQRARG